MGPKSNCTTHKVRKTDFLPKGFLSADSRVNNRNYGWSALSCVFAHTLNSHSHKSYGDSLVSSVGLTNNAVCDSSFGTSI